LIEDGFYCYGGDDTNADGCYEECGDARRYHATSITTFCDDGNNEDGDGCDAYCYTETGFYCEGGDYETPDTCYEICGDGANYGFLNCDDGNTSGYDGCSSDCNIETGYDCYGGSSSEADTCYEICGDGLNMGLLECDDGDTSGGMDGCSSGCAVVEGWYCYGGDHSNADGCYEICGDPYHYYYDVSNMQCDDGNSYDGDGCSSDCLIESGWDCTNDWVIATDYDIPTVCTEVCGDGVRFNTDTDYCDTSSSGVAVNGCNADCSV
jgi:cysteine-rich repeat protein